MTILYFELFDLKNIKNFCLNGRMTLKSRSRSLILGLCENYILDYNVLKFQVNPKTSPGIIIIIIITPKTIVFTIVMVNTNNNTKNNSIHHSDGEY